MLPEFSAVNMGDLIRVSLGKRGRVEASSPLAYRTCSFMISSFLKGFDMWSLQLKWL